MPECTAQAERLIYQEALALDEQRWDAWLETMHEDVVFWVPAWRSEHQPTENPQREISLIYCAGQQALRDRIARVRSGRSPASTPMPRTVHAVSNVMVSSSLPLELRTKAVFSTTVYDLRRGEANRFVGRYEHTFVRAQLGGAWLIASKRILLINDRIPGMLDFYCV